MGRTEEYLAKKRTKAVRKRLRNTVDFTRGVEAAKRRRKAGHRRACEGMCYTLPTPDDPFNDQFEQKILKKKAKKEKEEEENGILPLSDENRKNAKSHTDRKGTKVNKPKRLTNKDRKSVTTRSLGDEKPLDTMDCDGKSEGNVLNRKLEKIVWTPRIGKCSKVNGQWVSGTEDIFGVALCALLNAKMLTGPVHGGHDSSGTGTEVETIDTGADVRKLIASEWDWHFWEACGSGCDVLAMGRTYTAAACVLAAVSHIAAMSHEMRSLNPLVLYIVNTKEHALEVRNLFKLLKPLLCVHAVSLHTGTSLQHQIEGLAGMSPEILIATPDRLCDLLNVNAVSISNVSLMIVDRLSDIVSCEMGYQLDQIKSAVGSNVQTAALCGDISTAVSTACQKLLKNPIHRVVPAGASMLQSSALINQSVQVLISEDKRIQKLHKIIKMHKQSGGCSGGILVVFRQSQALQQVKDAISGDGYSVECLVEHDVQKNQQKVDQFRNGQILLSTENLVDLVDVSLVGTIVLYEFPSTMELYCELLTKMSRHTKDGILYSFCSGSTAPVASKLVEVLEECLQPVPPSLSMLAEAATMVEKQKS